MGTRGKRAQALAVTLAFGLAAPAFAAPAPDLYYERALMLAADGACRLFAPRSSPRPWPPGDPGAQRGDALGNGHRRRAPAIESRADAAAMAAGCASPDIAAAARQVQAAFRRLRQARPHGFPGEFAGWSAERTPTTVVPGMAGVAARPFRVGRAAFRRRRARIRPPADGGRQLRRRRPALRRPPRRPRHLGDPRPVSRLATVRSGRPSAHRRSPAAAHLRPGLSRPRR